MKDRREPIDAVEKLRAPEVLRALVNGLEAMVNSQINKRVDRAKSRWGIKSW
jgi:hypothetical protein